MRKQQQPWIVTDDPSAGHHGAAIGLRIFRLRADNGAACARTVFFLEKGPTLSGFWRRRRHLEDANVFVVRLACVQRQRECQSERRRAVQFSFAGFDEQELTLVSVSNLGNDATPNPVTQRDERRQHAAADGDFRRFAQNSIIHGILLDLREQYKSAAGVAGLLLDHIPANEACHRRVLR